MEINDRIERFSKQDKGEEQPVSADVEYGFTYEAVQKIDEALSRASEEERFSLAVDLFRLWVEAGVYRMKERQEEAQSVFGQLFDKDGDKRLMYTLTTTGEQLRVWYGSPSYMGPDHVDSCGRNLLFGVYGHPPGVERYLRALCEIYNLSEILVPNGVRLYMSWNTNWVFR